MSDKRRYQPAIILSLLFAIVLGVLLRFTTLSGLVYWYDEVYTTLRSQGLTETEFVRDIGQNPTVTVQQLQQYQHFDRNRNGWDVIHSLATEDPQHPPLYYLLTHFWLRWFGSEIAVSRSLAAIFSVLAIPAMYWVAFELFTSSWVGLWAAAILAISPFHILYAQEARQYSLWTVTILLSSGALLRALRQPKLKNWGLYAVTVALGLYTFLFSGLVCVSHGLYVLVTQKRKTWGAYLAASTLGVLLFSPWLWVIATSLAQVNQGTASQASAKLGLGVLSQKWAINVTRLFVDIQLGYGPDIILNRKEILTYAIAPLLILVGLAFYFLIRHTSRPVWLFVVFLVLVTSLKLILPDLILGGRRSTVSRYLTPCYLGIELAVAFLFSRQQRGIWAIAIALVLGGGMMSNLVNLNADTLWHKESGYYNPKLATVINQAQNPYIISDTEMGNILSLSYLLKPEVELYYQPHRCHTCPVNSTTTPDFPVTFSPGQSVFVFRPSRQLRETLETQGYSLNRASTPALYRLLP